MYKLTVLSIPANDKVVTEYATFSAARSEARRIIDDLSANPPAVDTAVKIRDANSALLFHEICEGVPFRRASSNGGKWYTRIHNVTRGKFKGKRFNTEVEARAHLETVKNLSRDYDTAFILRNPAGELVNYELRYGDADQLETRPPNNAD